jgi:hypothetical protein
VKTTLVEAGPQSLHCGGDMAFKFSDSLSGHFSNGARDQVLQQLFREVFQGARPSSGSTW